MAASAQVTLGFAYRAATALAVPDPVRHAQIGGIDRPRRDAGASLTQPWPASSEIGCATGVVSTSNRSLGVHSSAVHNAIRVDSLIWLGSLVNNADTDAEDSSKPGLLGQQPPQLGAGPDLALRGGHPQLPPDLHAAHSCPVSSLSVAVTARR